MSPEEVFENIPRSLPDTNLASKINWPPDCSRIFQWLQFEGGISDREMFSLSTAVSEWFVLRPCEHGEVNQHFELENCDGFKIGEVVSSDYARKNPSY